MLLLWLLLRFSLLPLLLGLRRSFCRRSVRRRSYRRRRSFCRRHFFCRLLGCGLRLCWQTRKGQNGS
jgi:hypothetical protein